jgi:hypothetical protein
LVCQSSGPRLRAKPSLSRQLISILDNIDNSQSSLFREM